MRELPNVQSLPSISGVAGQFASTAAAPVQAGLFRQVLGNLNEVSEKSQSLKAALVRGDKSVDVTDVMLASQEASLALTTVVEVRNKAMEAYKDIINMPV